MSNIIINLAVTTAALAFFYIVFKRKLSVNESQKRILENIEGQIRHIIVEMNNTTDRNVGIIEARIKELKMLISDADKRLSLLKNEQKINPQVVKAAYTIDRPINTMIISKKLSFKEQVLELAVKGFDSKIIAAKLEASIGEVELIISLAQGLDQ